MNFPLAYCPDGYARLARLRSLYEQREQDQICAVMKSPRRALARFAEAHAAGYCERPDLHERAGFWDDLLAEAVEVRDDSIPCAYLTELDQGLYGGLIGGRIQYMADPANGWISSMVPPVLNDWPELDALEIDCSGECYRFYLEALEVFRKAAAGKFGISHFILIDGMNFVFELVGATRTYLDAAENPDRVRQAIDLAHRLNVLVQRAFFEQIALVEGGTCSNMAAWIPGRVVSESVDPFHMTSAAYFERWGREAVERIFAEFDGGVVHIHGNGRHLLRAVASLRGLKGICLKNDKGYAPVIVELERLKACAGDVPLIIEVEFPDFVEAFRQHRLAGGALYKVLHVPDAETANRWMDEVREYRV
jgi:hypothetical protein